MKILLVSTQDYIHHPIPSRHHYIFEELARYHEVRVAHFHVSRGDTRSTRLIVEEATQFPLTNPLLHYTLNTPYHFQIFNKIIKEHGIDVVVASHVLAGTAVIHAAKKYHVPVVFDLKDWFPDSAAAYFKNKIIQETVRKCVWAITKKNLSNSDKVTTVSPSLVEKLKKHGFSAELITNGVDTDIFKPMDGSEKRKELGFTSDDFIIGFCGSIEHWYAIDEMIKALPELIRYHPSTKMLVVGGSLFTNYKTELQKLSAELNISERVVFTGTKLYSELPGYISCMDVCTIPLSPSQWGDIALPNKFFEYSACGKPILMRPIPDVTRIGGPNLCVFRTQEDYIAEIKNIMDSPVNFSIDLKKYSWKEKARQFETLLESIA